MEDAGALAREGSSMCVRRRRLVTVSSIVLLATLNGAASELRADDISQGQSGSPVVIASSNPGAIVNRGPVIATAATLGRPLPGASLGTPVPLRNATSQQAAIASISQYSPTPAAAAVDLAAPVVDRALAPASFDSVGGSQGVTVRMQAPDTPIPPPAIAPGLPPGGDVPPPPGLGAPGTTYGGVAVDQPIKKSFLDRCKDIFNPGNPDSKCGGWFQSDHAFDNCTNAGDLISPVTSPFFFEDPRALTEVRPLFLYQLAPNRNGAFSGGSSEYYGLQARVAFTDRWSLVISELGFISFQPHDSDVGLRDETGFAELRLGPKWTFYRDEQNGRVAAFGLTFDIPAGSPSVFQNTGSFSLDPYLSFGQTFGRSSYGTFNFMAGAGFWASVNDERSSYTHLNLHIDYDVANLHRIYPLFEMTWLHTTQFGKGNSDIGTEGADLVNFGSESYDGKRDLVTLAVGARYKFGASDHYQVGTAFEFPVTDRQDLQVFRFTLDFIIRY
jgi:hypothetical protein